MKLFQNILLFQLVSEEHNKESLDMSKVQQPDLHIQEVYDHTNFDEIVPVEELTVWVDPLDATQEYTGMERLLFAALTFIAVR